MGYRSDVKLITTKVGWKRVQRAVQKVAPDDSDYIVGDSYTTELSGGKYVLLELEDVKWYEGEEYGFYGVNAFMRELRRFDAEHIPYQYFRVGEDWDDNEYLYEYDWQSDKYDDMPQLVLERKIEVEY